MMARLLSLLLTLCLLETTLAQQPFNYEKAWQEADSLARQSLPKSAITVVDRIYRQAKASRNQPQLVKAVVVKGQLIMELDEAAWKTNLSTLTRETAAAPQPVKQVLYSITAQLYWDYFQQQRWKIYNRSSAPAFRKEDPETWGLEDFHRQIAAAYRASLSNPGLLQQTNLAAYDPVILKGNTRHLRPTLYDLLAHEALDYFENTETGITRPAYAFELNEPVALAAAPRFVRHSFASKDSSNHVLQAIRIYQDLLRFHLSDPQPAALIDADVKRIVFANLQSIHPDKDRFYRETLERLYQQYPQEEQAMQAGSLLAAWWKEKGDQYQPSGRQEFRMAYVEARNMAQEVVSRFPKSEGGIQAQNLLQELEQPLLQVQAERVNTVDQPFRVLVNFKNTRTVHFRLLALPGTADANESNEEANSEAWWQQWTKAQPLRSWSQPLPAMNDLRMHSAELKIDGLPAGKYLLLAGTDEQFTPGKSPLNATRIYVSNISFFHEQNRYYVVNRITGAPLVQAAVQTWRSHYDYNIRKNIRHKGRLYTTNDQGFVQISDPEGANSGNLLLQISWQGDVLFMDDAISNYYYDPA
ncbi:MAG: hypothetical protein MUF29_10435, partial [Chitinophagaceae bacterium]|nr:hypothetical protein [Chitinophagaceae bacterium]